MKPAPRGAAPSPPSPAALAGRRLYEPLAPLLARFPHGLPDAASLSAVYREFAPDGRPLRFVAPPEPAPAYEAHIHATGEVPTRPDNWHDFFNALAWCVWPQAKAAMNARHLRELAARAEAGLAGRGPVRDALTQFDECGLLVVSSEPQLAALLAAHRWEEVLWTRRAQLLATTRFLVVGHASWDQLRAPFVGLCAKTLQRVVAPDWLRLSPDAQQADADRWLAHHFTHTAALAPRDWRPLPLLGIPGVSPHSEAPDYYRDGRQFRPLRAPAQDASGVPLPSRCPSRSMLPNTSADTGREK